MKQVLVGFVAIGSLTTAAAADDASVTASSTPRSPTAYVGLGGVASADKYLHVGVTLEGGIQLAGSPLYLRALGSTGHSGNFWSPGSYAQLRLGLEGRVCTISGRACGYGGLDLGMQRDTIESGDSFEPDYMTNTHDAAVAVPRAGIDAGGERLRLRVGLEAPIYKRFSPDHGPVPGLGLTTALAFAF